MRYTLLFVFMLLFSCNKESASVKMSASNGDSTIPVEIKNDTRKARNLLVLLGNAPQSRRTAILYSALADRRFSESPYLAKLCDIQANYPEGLRATVLADNLKRGKLIDAFSRDFYNAFKLRPVNREQIIEVLDQDGRFSPVATRINFSGVLLSGIYQYELRKNSGSQAYALIARLLEEGRRRYPFNGLDLAELIVTDSGWINEFSIKEENRVTLLQKLVKNAKIERDSIDALLVSYVDERDAILREVYRKKNIQSPFATDINVTEKRIPLFFYFESWWADSVNALAVDEVQKCVRAAGFPSFSYMGAGDWYEELPTIEVTALDSFDMRLRCSEVAVELVSLETGVSLFVDSIGKSDFYDKLLHSDSKGVKKLQDLCQGKRIGVEYSPTMVARNLLKICELLQKGDSRFRLYVRD